MKYNKTVRDFMSPTKHKGLEGLPIYHNNCLKVTKAVRPRSPH